MSINCSFWRLPRFKVLVVWERLSNAITWVYCRNFGFGSEADNFSVRRSCEKEPTPEEDSLRNRLSGSAWAFFQPQMDEAENTIHMIQNVLALHC
jgi:hypothetical protein